MTKGVWVVREIGDHDDPSYEIVAEKELSAPVTVAFIGHNIGTSVHGLTRNNLKEDAQLIAAAPMLLAACKGFINIVEESTDLVEHMGAVELIKIAIKDAEGI